MGWALKETHCCVQDEAEGPSVQLVDMVPTTPWTAGPQIMYIALKPGIDPIALGEDSTEKGLHVRAPPTARAHVCTPSPVAWCVLGCTCLAAVHWDCWSNVHHCSSGCPVADHSWKELS